MTGFIQHTSSLQYWHYGHYFQYRRKAIPKSFIDLEDNKLKLSFGTIGKSVAHAGRNVIKGDCLLANTTDRTCVVFF